ncbi:hypothetical protein GWI33_010314 [Rhynchophorus ferrugineus]|uniref:Uncharacterized protein n=1 Tax=Rhynchophorus ferrugineus TaxID=354439 RepID=A0A834MA99_RHYFE|nr:hypothetical protein GWI33_010314 [Rhynchophorus ferrugineus]
MAADVFSVSFRGHAINSNKSNRNRLENETNNVGTFVGHPAISDTLTAYGIRSPQIEINNNDENSLHILDASRHVGTRWHTKYVVGHHAN